MEFEFIFVDKAWVEVEWLRYFVEDISKWPEHLQLYIYIHWDKQNQKQKKKHYIVDIISFDNYYEME